MKTVLAILLICTLPALAQPFYGSYGFTDQSGSFLTGTLETTNSSLSSSVTLSATGIIQNGAGQALTINSPLELIFPAQIYASNGLNIIKGGFQSASSLSIFGTQIGALTSVHGDKSVVIGFSASDNAFDDTVGIGQTNNAWGTNAIGLGRNTSASNNAFAAGMNATAGPDDIVIGRNSQSLGFTNSAAFGYAVTNTANNQILAGPGVAFTGLSLLTNTAGNQAADQTITNALSALLAAGLTGNSNWTGVLSTNSTNWTTSQAQGASNYAGVISTNATNFIGVTSTNATNFAKSIGTTATNVFQWGTVNGSNVIANITAASTNLSLSGNLTLFNTTNKGLFLSDFNGGSSALIASDGTGDLTASGVITGGTLTAGALLQGGGGAFSVDASGDVIGRLGTFTNTLIQSLAGTGTNTLAANSITIAAAGNVATLTLNGTTLGGHSVSIQSSPAGLVLGPVLVTSSGNATGFGTISSGSITASGTLSTGTSAGEAPTLISVGASPFTFNCPSGKDVFVFIWGGIFLNQLTLNGVSLFQSGTGPFGLTIPMRPGDSLVASYTTGNPPSMYYIAR